MSQATQHNTDEEDYGSDIDFDEELQGILHRAESAIIQSQFQEPVPDDGDLILLGRATVTKPRGGDAAAETTVGDIEDIDVAMEVLQLSPFQEFRKKGWLSVSDLVGGIWCEVQWASSPLSHLYYRAEAVIIDSRLRSLPYLPAKDRPDTITTKSGNIVQVNKVKVEDKEKILQRGQVIHKRLEREIHPEEIVVKAETREDVWGLRFLNMFSAVEALLTIGKCREMPVVGYVNGVLIMGIIDEITRQPIAPPTYTIPLKTRSKTKAPDPNQQKLSSFFTSTSSPTKSKSKTQPPILPPQPNQRTHKLYISDSKTRASGIVPRESDTTAGKLQCMLYKELLDGMLLAPFQTPSIELDDELVPSQSGFMWEKLFEDLELDMGADMSEGFVLGAKAIVLGNGIRYGVGEVRTLRGFVHIWGRYVGELGLGRGVLINGGVAGAWLDKGKGKEKAVEGDDGSIESGADSGQVGPIWGANNLGKTEDKLELVYRRAGVVRKKEKGKPESGPSGRVRGKKGKRRRKGAEEIEEKGTVELPIITSGKDDEEMAIQRAIEASLTEATSVETSAMPSSTVTEIDWEIVDAAPLVNDFADTRVQLSLSDEEKEGEEDELAWAVEMSLGVEPVLETGETGEIVLRTSQSIPLSPIKSTISSPLTSPPSSPDTPPFPKQSSTTQDPKAGPKSGAIIGKTVFKYDKGILEDHLQRVLGYWMGEREAEGVGEEEVRRCAWCEFENGCEWRTKKAAEALERYRTRGRGV